MDELRALLALRLTSSLGSRKIAQLQQYFGNALSALQANECEWESAGMDKRNRTALEQTAAALSGDNSPTNPWNRAAKEQENCERLGVKLVGRGMSGYPTALEALYDPPPVLWLRGDLPQTLETSIGLVGTRNASSYGLQIARQLGGDLGAAGVCVVSGLARGIDTAAHSAALEAGGDTVAVLGCGVDIIYPKENTALARRLPLLSEHPLGTAPAQHHFPARNRLIAGLCAGVVVIEGERKSGSMITATQALECGRSVFAVPGRAGDARAAGPHQLLREGAVLTESAEDIFQELGWQVVINNHTEVIHSSMPHSFVPPMPAKPIKEPSSALGKQIYAALRHEALTLDSLLAISPLAAAGRDAVQIEMMLLQMDGWVHESGGRWERRR